MHGVLDQAARGVNEIAELAGLNARRVDDVRKLEAREVAGARAVALFTIGETPWSTGQRAALLDGLPAGRLAVVAIHSATDSCYGWNEYGQLVGTVNRRCFRAALASPLPAFDSRFRNFQTLSHADSRFLHSLISGRGELAT